MTAEDHIPEFLETVLERPDSFAYWGGLDLDRWGFCLMQHRDSDSITRSNWACIVKDAQAKFPDSFEIMQCSHSLVGWMDHLMIDTHDKEAVAWYVENVWLPLADYPVYDEEHWSETEGQDAWDTFTNCYQRDIERNLEDVRDELRYSADMHEDLSEKDELTLKALNWYFDLTGEEQAGVLFAACGEFAQNAGTGDDFSLPLQDANLYATICTDLVRQWYNQALADDIQGKLPL